MTSGLSARTDRVVQPPAPHGAGRERFDDDVGAGHQAAGELARLGPREVEGHRALARVGVGEHLAAVESGLALGPGRQGPPGVEAPGGFHADHVRAELGQEAPGDGPGDHPGEVDDPQAAQRAGRPPRRAGAGRRPFLDGRLAALAQARSRSGRGERRGGEAREGPAVEHVAAEPRLVARRRRRRARRADRRGARSAASMSGREQEAAVEGRRVELGLGLPGHEGRHRRRRPRRSRPGRARRARADGRRPTPSSRACA